MTPACHQYGQAATHLLGTQDWCRGCLDAFLDPIRERIAVADGAQGVGLGVHPADGWPESHWALACNTCGATWVGRRYDPCRWCEQWTVVALRVRAEQMLTAPDVDPSDARHPDVMRRWATQLADGVAAEIITEAQASAAWRRALRKEPHVAA